MIPENLRPFALDLGRAIMPANHGIKGYDEESLDRLERLLGRYGDGVSSNVTRLLRLLQLRVSVLPRSKGKDRKQQISRALDDICGGGEWERQLFKMIATLFKIAHFDSPEVYESIGKNYDRTAPNEEPRSLRGVVDLDALKDLAEFELDAIVVGSGAGGAVIAYELAAAGMSVLIVEEGEHHGRSQFNRSAVDSSINLYWNRGLVSTIGSPPIYLPVGRAVGGTTIVNSGTCYRTPTRVLRKWTEMGLRNWEAEKMAPHFERVERILGVARAEEAYLGGCATVIARGCDTLGYSHQPLLRNAQECDGQGVCAFGCPTDAKRSTNVSYVPMALGQGAFLAAGTRLEEITTRGRNVTGVRVRHLASNTPIQLKSKLLVLSTGTLATPLILKQTGIKNRWLGRNLSIHPAASVVGEFDETIDGDLAIPQGYAIEAFHDEGILFEGGSVPLEVLAGGLFLHGPTLQSVLSRFRHLAVFGFLVEDKGRGRVLGRRDMLPLVHYSLSREAARKIHRGMEILAGVYLAAGAKEVRPQLQEDLVIRNWDDLRAFRARPIDRSKLELTAYHPLGTARMGADENQGVVDSQGRVYGLDNLVVADGSILPTSPAVNPQITIMAVATQIAKTIRDDAGKMGITL